MQSVNTPYQVFHDIDGDQLNYGYIYVGESGKNAETNPVNTFWDADLTIPAPQPIRTLNGFPSYNGSRGVIYVAEADYSVLTKNKNGTQIDSVLSQKERIDASVVNGNISKLDSISALIAGGVGAKDGAVVIVSSYHASLAGGGGPFKWEAARDKADHDGIVVFDPEVPFPTDWEDSAQLSAWFTAGTGTGCWVRQYTGIIRAEFGGAKGSPTLSDAQVLNHVFSKYDQVAIGSYHKLLEPLILDHGKTIICNGSSVLDGDFPEFDTANGTKVLEVGSDEMTQIADLSGNLAKGDEDVTFATAHGLNLGDVFVIYNPADYSWSSSRASYRAGEFCEVAEVTSSTEVKLTAPLYDDYTSAAVDVYKPTMGTFDVVGSLTVKSTKPTAGGATYSVQLNQVKKSVIEGLKAYANGGAYIAISLRKCFDVQLPNYIAVQAANSTLSGDYGVAISNSQNIITKGSAKAYRHAITHGGGDYVGCVPCRGCIHEGTWKTTSQGGVNAIDTHGNAENIHFNGIAYGGVSAGGQGFRYRGTIHADSLGICVYGGEVTAFDHDFSGTTMISHRDPAALSSGRGVVDYGTGGTFEADNMKSGVMDFSDVKLIAPNADFGLNIRTRNTTFDAGAYKIIKLDNAFVHTKAGGKTFNIRDSSGKDYNKVVLKGLEAVNGDTTSVINTTKIIGQEQRGSEDYTTTTSVNFVNVTVTFPDAYPASYIPVVTPMLTKAAIGVQIEAKVTAISNTSCTIRVYTYDGSNFGAAQTNPVYWHAG